MFKVISLGALAFAPVAIANQQAVPNQNKISSYPQIFDDVFESIFTAPDSIFDNGDIGNFRNNFYNDRQNQQAFKDLKRSSMYSSWKWGFGNFLDNLDKSSRYDLPATLSVVKQNNNNSWGQKPKFEDYANVIQMAINQLPEGPNKNSIIKLKDTMPFVKKLLNNKGSKTDFYGKMLKRIFSVGSNDIPSELMRNNLWDLKNKIDRFNEEKNWQNNNNNSRIEIKDFLKEIQNNAYGVGDLEKMFKNYFPYENEYSEKNIDQFLATLKYKDKEKYKELFEKFENILDKNYDIGNIDFDNIVNNLDPNAINSIIKNEDIFKKLGSNAPTMNSIQKGLTIAGGFGTLLISFFTAALALKLILIKSSRRAIALSSTGTITLFGTGVALIILAFI